MLLSFENVAFGYGDNLIFSGVSFTVNEGERIGLVGANGEGKTTLLNLISGNLSPDSGTIFLKNGARLGYLEQNGGYTSGGTVYEEMKKVFKAELDAIGKIAALSAELSNLNYGGSEYNAVSAKIESLEKFVAARGGYDADVKIKTVLNGMGFSAFYDRVIDGLSGGEKTKLKLCRLLLEQPDLLLLDEPTNHLDIGTLFWLEDYLKGFKGALVVVSHDRYFLDRTTTKTIEIENGGAQSYAGAYTKYKALKAERYTRLLKEYEKAVEERAKLKDYIDRNIVRATTAKSAQSRVKKLQRDEEPEKPYLPPEPPKFSFTFSERPSESVLKVENLNLERGGKRLISAGQFEIKRGDKVALVGANGTGKTSLLKQIMTGDPAVVKGRFVHCALFDQEGLNLNGDNTVLSEMWGRHVVSSQTDIRAALARAGLAEEDMNKKVSSLSGGERAKLALCILGGENANFLILDEPTNHLDLPARESLEKALSQYDGTLLFVSHDRYFISALAHRILEIEDGKILSYEGGYEGYCASKAEAAENKRREEELKRQQRRKAESEKSFRSAKERAQEAKKKEEIKNLERRIGELESEEQEINRDLSNPQIVSDYKKVAELTKRLSDIKLQLDGLYLKYGDML